MRLEQRMALSHHHLHLVVEQRLAADLRDRCRAEVVGQEGEIDGAAFQQRDEFGRPLLDHLDAVTVITGADLRQQLQQHAVGEAGDHAERDFRPLPARTDQKLRLRGLHLGQDHLCVFVQPLAVIRQDGAALAAHEQRHAEVPLQLGDGLGQRRLGEADMFGGLVEIPLVGEGQKVLELAEFHSRQYRPDIDKSQ
jgi:hypothetical protein